MWLLTDKSAESSSDLQLAHTYNSHLWRGLRESSSTEKMKHKRSFFFHRATHKNCAITNLKLLKMKLTIWVLERQNDKSLTAIHAPGMSHRVKETNHFFPLNF